MHKPAEEFSRNKRTVDGRQYICRQCQAEDRAAKAALNPRVIKPRPVKYKVKRIRQTKAEAADKDKMRRYGLTLEELQELRRTHAGLCALCQREIASLHIDHDHVTGKVRGLLCFSCNSKLGWLERLGVTRVIAYLKQG